MIDQANVLRNRVRNKKVEEEKHAPQKFARVITVASGKGGVGKTNFAVNLAINFSKKGKRVVVLDADFGLANVEILFGIIPKYSLAHVILGDKKIENIICDGPMGIKFISAGTGFKELANISEGQMQYIIKSFGYLDSIFDIIIIDTGAGISNSVINFIKVSSETVIITTPEPTSVTDAYAIIKTLTDYKYKLPIFKIVVNKVDDENEGKEVFEKLSHVCKNFLDVNIVSLGSIPDDKYLVKAVKRQEPVAICYPNSEVSKSIEKISFNLIDIDIKSNDEFGGIMSYMKKLANIFKE